MGEGGTSSRLGQVTLLYMKTLKVSPRTINLPNRSLHELRYITLRLDEVIIIPQNVIYNHTLDILLMSIKLFKLPYELHDLDV